ncbi:class I SAM-dependent methyltransferase [Paraburkholderia sp. Ac-20340]|uniref:SAM-dependent methyltransferase n=1 Tax=Paraburkholderia sp. Ac-20340 TaxID=2703888 RepID=UPI00198012BE|nr:cyclopropane-fatty-acyl-phospholipid synthase family protein [Paraburkholderia sp. Ac-20340]MBN3856212.1 class I SAM-dependent methyltransferase [Paraburkholderia sp. Ac-20340]
MTLLHLLRLPGFADKPVPLASRLAAPVSSRLFMALLRRIRHGHLTLTTPDGNRHVFGDLHDEPGAALHLHDGRACAVILRAGDIGFAQALREQWVDSPDLVALLRLAIRNEAAVAATVHGGTLARLWFALRHRLRANTREGSRQNIHAHYDLGNPFYALWLDRTWTYSSACFDGDLQRPLADAQAAKYQRVIDTLGLRPGMEVLEIGCGWGGFAIHAARQGIRVRALTISQAQYAIAVERVMASAQGERARVELCDYRDAQGQYDAIVSIEMFEAVGEAFWPAYFATLARCLKPGARALIQSITIGDGQFEHYRASSDFIRETIFPGGMLPSPGQFATAAQRAGLDARATFAFGRDYAHTLRLWRAAFEAQLDKVREQGFDEAFIRIWRLYFAYCEAAFDEGRTDVMHFVVGRATHSSGKPALKV